MVAQPSGEPSEPVLVIFDHDGVLTDTLALHQAAWLELGRRAGLPITADFVRETFGMPNPAIFLRLLGESAERHDLVGYSELKELCYRETARDRITLMAGVREVLDELAGLGCALAIGSSAVRANLDLTVEVCGLAGRFAAIVALEDVQRGKPDPQVFLKAADKAGVDSNRSAVFEDATFGIQAARAAGMYTIGVTTTRSARELQAAGADEVVASLSGFNVARLVRRLRES
ncbi:MAG: HAD family hydrolase [Isosphaeraceae bacterium]